jgi:hypothetical protein
LGLESLEQSDGRSLVSTLVSGGHEPESTRPDFAQLDQTWGQIKSKPKPSFGVQKGSYRLIRKSVVGDSGDSLYDLKRDPGEQSSVAEENPEVLEDLRAALEEYEEEGPVFDSVPHIELNDMELRQLRALGYAVQ